MEESQSLGRAPLFQIHGHSLHSGASELFAPCSTQRLYLHEHVDFDGINEVRLIESALLALEAQRAPSSTRTILPGASVVLNVQDGLSVMSRLAIGVLFSHKMLGQESNAYN